MTKASFVLMVFAASFPVLSADAARVTLDLNEGWSGTLSPEKGSERRLSDIRLPHSWMDYHGMRRLRHGCLHGSCAYFRTFGFKKKPGRRQFLVFDGIGMYATVKVNGRKICAHRPAGRVVTTLEATEAVRDGVNELEVVCEHPSDIQDLPWICGGCCAETCEGPEPLGLFRPARLVDTDRARIVPFGIHLWYDEKIERGFANVEVDASEDVHRVVRLIQKDLSVDLMQEVSLRTGAIKTVHFEFPLKGVKRWSLEDPNLYTFVVEIRDAEGDVLDRDTARTGYRTVIWPKTNADKRDRRFFLNGKPVFIHGVCETDHRFGGSMAFEREEIDARCAEVRKLGFNAFRDGHEPHDLRYSMHWDEDGILWWPQFTTHLFHDNEAFRANFRAAIVQWVRERRNSPSVVLWGLQNESNLPQELAAECTALIKEMDPLTGSRGRLVTTCNGGIGADWDVIQDWCGTYGGRFGVLENYENALRKDAELLNGEYGSWRVAGWHDDPDKKFVFMEPYTEEHAVRVLVTKLLKAWSVRGEVCGHFLWTLFTHENPGRESSDEGYRLIDKVGPVNNKGPYLLWGRRTEAWYAYRAYGHHLKNGTLDSVASKPMSWWIAEGHRLAEPQRMGLFIPKGPDGLACVFRLNCGGDRVVDSLGQTWAADDTRYVRSWSTDDDLRIDGFKLDPVLGSQDEVRGPIVNADTCDQELLRTFRFGRNRLRFELPAPPETMCTVEALFVEPGSYGRVFDVALNGRTVERGFDLGSIPERNVVRKRWTVQSDTEGGIRLSFPRVAANQAVVSALAVYCSQKDAAHFAAEMRPVGYPASANKSWKTLTSEVAVKVPDAMMPPNEAAKIFPVMANQPPPSDRDGFHVGWFGPNYAKDYTVVFRVKAGNPIGRKLVWQLEDDQRTAVYAKGELTIDRVENGRISLKLPLEVNAGWYYILYRTDGFEVVAVEWR